MVKITLLKTGVKLLHTGQFKIKIVWVSLWNSIDQQVKGYKHKSKDPMQGGCARG